MMDDIGWMESSQAKQEERAPKNPKKRIFFLFQVSFDRCTPLPHIPAMVLRICAPPEPASSPWCRTRAARCCIIVLM
jgi:hypothetical protein